MRLFTDLVQFFINVCPFNQTNFQIYFQTLTFCCHFTECWGKINFFWIQGMPFFDHFNRFQHFWQRYHSLIIPSICAYTRDHSGWISTTQKFVRSEIQRWTGLIQSWFSLKQRRFFQFSTAGIQRKSELLFFMFSEPALKNIKVKKVFAATFTCLTPIVTPHWKPECAISNLFLTFSRKIFSILWISSINASIENFRCRGNSSFTSILFLA